jgi:alcohol dehydrogenase (NADP+)
MGQAHKSFTTMKLYPLSSGSTIPGLGLGTWKSDPGVVGAAVKAAIEMGYRHIDCAHIYGNEKEIGEAFAQIFQESPVKREHLFVTSKLWNTEHAPSDVEPALKNTLSNLGLDYLDLYLIHWPIVQKKEGQPGAKFIPLEEIPIAETWKAMEKCVDAGLVKDIGVSNFSVKKLKSLLATARIKPAVNQVERHPYLQSQELLNFCNDNGIHLTAYSPLGSNDRPTISDHHEKPILEDPMVAKIAKKHNVMPAQVLLQWALACGTSVIPKSTHSSRLKENLDAATAFELDVDDRSMMATLDKHSRYGDGTFFCKEDSPYTVENLWDEEDLGVVTSKALR